ncbi:hypothetical protein TWF694_008658 [Orbilia ellipsospora]|uniref:Up-regulated during septation protein 1 domain-containing protein n=1 Tax=Orbilia ellipsospora TaxID=2528407 RepID=A0AAV9XH89_9PEZI
MAASYHSDQPLNVDDDIALHLLIETAIFDSSSYEVLSHEEVDQIKREKTILDGRIEALKRKLLLETKVRDAAQSLSRLQAPKRTEGANSSPISFSRGGSNNIVFDPTAQASVELSSSIAKCSDISNDIRKIEIDSWQLQRRLLCHTSRVLAAAYHTTRPRTQRSSTATQSLHSLQVASGKIASQIGRGSSLEDFDDRSLYRPASKYDGSPLIQPGQSKNGGSREISHSIGSAITPSRRVLAADHRSLQQAQSVSNALEPSLVDQKLKNLNAKLQTILREMGHIATYPESPLDGIAASRPNSEDGAKSRCPSDSPGSVFEQRIVFLDQGLEQVQNLVFNRPTKDSELNIREPVGMDEQHLDRIWDILHTYNYELQIQEAQFARWTDDLLSQAALQSQHEIQHLLNRHSDPEKILDVEAESKHIKHLPQIIQSLVRRSLRLGDESIKLREQLHRILAEKELEKQKSEDMKNGYEQQIIGLTSSLSNTLNELSQVSSQHDTNVSNLRQENTKLQADFDNKDSIHLQQLEELKNRLSTQETEYDKAISKERQLEEKISQVKEELSQTSRDLENKLMQLRTAERRNETQQECIDSLRGEIEEKEMVISDIQNKRLLDNQAFEDLNKRLQVREDRIIELESAAPKQNTSIVDPRLDSDSYISQLEASRAAEATHKAKVLELEDDVQQLVQEIEKLSAELEAADAASQQRIDEIKKQAAATLQAEKGKTQSAMDTSLLLELESLSKQNEELLKANVSLQAKLSEVDSVESGENEVEYRVLKENCERLQKELNDMLLDYERLVRASVDFEAERIRLEAQIDILQDKIEYLESNLADERIRMLGNGSPIKSPATQMNGMATPLSSTGDAMNMSVLRAEFKKMVKDMRTEHSKALRVSFPNWHPGYLES